MQRLKNRIEQLEAVIRQQKEEEPEQIIHVKFVRSPHSDPEVEHIKNDYQWGTMEEQIARQRAEGKKVIVVFSDEDPLPGAEIMAENELSALMAKF